MRCLLAVRERIVCLIAQTSTDNREQNLFDQSLSLRHCAICANQIGWVDPAVAFRQDNIVLSQTRKSHSLK